MLNVYTPGRALPLSDGIEVNWMSTHGSPASRVSSRSFYGLLVGGSVLLGACGGATGGPAATSTPEAGSTTPIATPTAAPVLTSTPIATAMTYTVEAGDTGLAIALEFGISLAELAEANGMSEAELDHLQIGQELTIPSTTP